MAENGHRSTRDEVLEELRAAERLLGHVQLRLHVERRPKHLRALVQRMCRRQAQ